MANQAVGARIVGSVKWGLLLVLAALAVQQAATSGARAQAQEPKGKVEARVLDSLAADGQATFFVVLRDEADLSPAYGIQNRAQRGSYVYKKLNAVAQSSQASLRALLETRAASYKAYWIINAIRVTGDEALLQEIAAQPDVVQILADKKYSIPKPTPGSTEPGIDTVEWGIDRIRAPLVWSTFGDRGDGIVVANIDTGVQFDHPALVRQYRGNQGGGNFDHNYNWFDPSNVCGNPSLAPCDNVAHGTHTMGTMVGDDGDPGPNQIGVAPHARWIAAKGCESNSCSLSALLASGQWVLAPTDLNGNNPRPDLRPHVVNNSWGDGPTDPFYRATVQAWVASGIFPAFANGNSGSSCNTVGVPGAYPESYGVGAFDINNNIAGFSSRGPSAFGGITKPNVSAPGVNVRSSVPGNSYSAFSGTSMATPHLAGTIALMWSAAPALLGNIAATRALLDTTAIDMSDLSCGGTAGNNNVWGEGRLDAFASVDQSPRGPIGTLAGVVTDASSSLPIAGASIVVVGPSNRSTLTDGSGHYSMTLPVGSYDVTASRFGYLTQTATGVGVTEGNTTIQDFALAAAPSHQVSGHVRDQDGGALAGAMVTILGTPIPPATTDASGAYSFASVPEGEYDVKAEAGRCNDAQTQHLVVDGNETLDFALPQRSDSFGYFCRVEATPAYIEANTVIPLSGDDASVPVSLPFPFVFYGQTHNTAHVATNGFLNFLAPNATFSNSSIPSTFPPNGAIYPYWDDMFVDGSGSVRTELLGAAPNRSFVIEWRNIAYFGDFSRRVDFEVILHENGRIQTEYRNIANDGREMGNSATLGIENQSGTVALQYSFNEAVIGSPSFGVLYRLPPSGFIEGHVTDYNDHLALSGATVKVMQGGQTVRQMTTDAAGFYRTQVRVGDYDVVASAANYATGTAIVHVSEDQTTVQDFVLQTARGVVSPTSLQLIVPPNQTRTRRLTLTNNGSQPMTWEIRETGGGAAQAAVAVSDKAPGFDANATTTSGLYINGTPPGWTPQSPGDVIRSWPTAPLSLAWGVGYTGNVWLSDVPSNDRNHEFTVLGAATGRSWPAPWAGAWPGDMAYDAGRGIMCQVNVGGDNGIYCWNPNTGAVVGSITGAFPWTSISQRGVAYRPDDDTFYIGGWNQGILYHVKGLSYPDKGAVISQCNPPDPNISGLAWNPAFSIVWAATNSPTDTIYELNPDTCAVITTLPHPNPGFNGAGLEEDEAGNLWMLSQNAHNAYLVDSGVPAFQDVPWISESPTSGTLAVGASQNITVNIDTHGLNPGVYNATLFIQTNSGRNPTLRVAVHLIVPSYQVGANVGGGVYSDGNGDTWSADQAYSPGGWGYTVRANTAVTRSPIAGTDDDPLYQDARRGQTEYRFDGLATGVYQVELRFAEIQNRRPTQRLFDVIIEGSLVLPAFDIASEVGLNAADDKSFFFAVTDGQLNIRFISRQADKEPLINAIRVTQRPDR